MKMKVKVRWLFVLICFVVLPVSASDQPFKVTLLGTGNPLPNAERFGASILVEAGTKKIVIDMGRGALVRLSQAGVKAPQIDAVFLTHLHSDHITDVDDLLLTGWARSPFGGRSKPFSIYGPAGVQKMMDNLVDAYAADIGIRTKVDKPHPEGIQVDATSLRDGQSYDFGYSNGGLRVTAFTVDHGPIKPSFGFLVEHDNRKLLISGDTTYSENVISYGKDVDVLIHEVAAASQALLESWPLAKRIYSVHTSPDDLAKVLRQTKPKLSVLTHFILLGSPQIAAPTVGEVVRAIQAGYDGDVLAADDLTSIIIDDIPSVVSRAMVAPQQRADKVSQ